MKTRTILSLVLAAAASTAWAQQPPTEVITPAQRIEAANARIDELQKQVEELTEKLNKQAENVTALAATVQEHDTQIKQIDEQFANVINGISDQLESQNRILDAIATQDSSGPTLAIANMMKNSPQFKQELGAAVNESLPTSGLLTVVNRTNVRQDMVVNRERVLIIDPGQERQIELPIGTITTEVQGEGQKVWSITTSNNRLKLEINPPSAPALLNGYWYY